jgi:hypothetical protein
LSRITHAEFGKEKGRMVRVKMREGGTAWRTVAMCFSCAVICVFKSEPWLGVKGEIGLFLVGEITMLWHSRNKGVGFKISNTCLIIEKSSKST